MGIGLVKEYKIAKPKKKKKRTRKRKRKLKFDIKL